MVAMAAAVGTDVEKTGIGLLLLDEEGNIFYFKKLDTRFIKIRY